MTVGIVAYISVVGACIALAAWILEGGLRLAELPGRWAWVGAIGLLLGAIFLAPQAGTVMEHASQAAEYPEAVSGEGPLLPAAQSAGAKLFLGKIRSSVASSPGRIAAAVDESLPHWATSALKFVWIATSGLLLLILAVVHLRYRRRMTGWPTQRLRERDVQISDDVGPAVIGLRRPAIVLPRSLLEVSVTELDVVLAHEEEHLSARDNWLLTGGCVAAALLPWHPASWWMLARLRLAVELDCDRRVLRRGIGRRLYGETLIDLGARRRPLHLGIAALADHSTHLERRLVAMTSTSRRFARSRAATLIAASALIVAVACEARLPTAPEIERMDVAAAESSPLAKSALSSDAIPIYEVDGKPAAATDARGLSPDQIASIEVVKGSRAGEATTIRIVTRGSQARTGTASPEPGDSKTDAILYLGPTQIGPQRLESSAVLGIERIERFEGLVLIDGVRSSRSALSRIDPTSIASIEVLKGSAATTLYREPEAANGVILVRMKPGSGAQ
jgi:beta-lactamase regulating signal transducer with metallopeptidase domain